MKRRLILVLILIGAVAVSGIELIHSHSADDPAVAASAPEAGNGLSLTGDPVSPGALTPVAQFADRDVRTVDVFREPLAPYGRWTTIPTYGYVWEPVDVAAGWGPYVDGSWVYTDYGWTWVSDDPWGWATCHYGRWGFEPAYGWFWVPGSEWGPAWVDWEFGDGFIGWAPLFPGFGFDSFAFEPIPVAYYRFVRVGDFDDRDIGRFVLPITRNEEIFHHVRRITDYSRVDGRIINRSVTRQAIERATGRSVRTRVIHNVDSPNAARGFRGNEVSMFRPRVSSRSQAANGMRPGRINATNPAETSKQQQKLERQQARQQQKLARQQTRQEQRVERRQAQQQIVTQRAFRQQQARQFRQAARTQRQIERPQMRARPAQRQMTMPRPPQRQMMQQRQVTSPRMNMRPAAPSRPPVSRPPVMMQRGFNGGGFRGRFGGGGSPGGSGGGARRAGGGRHH